MPPWRLSLASPLEFLNICGVHARATGILISIRLAPPIHAPIKKGPREAPQRRVSGSHLHRLRNSRGSSCGHFYLWRPGGGDEEGTAM